MTYLFPPFAPTKPVHQTHTFKVLLAFFIWAMAALIWWVILHVNKINLYETGAGVSWMIFTFGPLTLIAIGTAVMPFWLMLYGNPTTPEEKVATYLAWKSKLSPIVPPHQDPRTTPTVQVNTEVNIK